MAVEDWTTAIPLPSLIPDAEQWRCNSCGISVSAAKLPLEPEDQLCYLVPQVLEASPQESLYQLAEDRRRAGEVREFAFRVVSPMHWTWMLATFAWLQKCMIEIHCRLLEFSTSELQQSCRDLLTWFEVCAPECIMQRLSAIRVVARLAVVLGDGLENWGCDVKDPFGWGMALPDYLGKHPSPEFALLQQSMNMPETPPTPQPGKRMSGARLYHAEWQLAEA